MLLRQLNFGVMLTWQLFYVYYKRKAFLSSVAFIVTEWKGVEPWKLLSNVPFEGLVAYKLVACLEK